MSADIKKETRGQSRVRKQYSAKPKTMSFTLADPLKREDSDLRFNLIGAIKQVPKRERQHIKTVIPPGANPGFKLKY